MQHLRKAGNTKSVLVGKREGKRLLRRPRRRREDNIKKSLNTLRYGAAWIHLAHNKENRLFLFIMLIFGTHKMRGIS
jgi:hypothetical protein